MFNLSRPSSTTFFKPNISFSRQTSTFRPSSTIQNLLRSSLTFQPLTFQHYLQLFSRPTSIFQDHLQPFNQVHHQQPSSRPSSTFQVHIQQPSSRPSSTIFETNFNLSRPSSSTLFKTISNFLSRTSSTFQNQINLSRAPTTFFKANLIRL